MERPARVGDPQWGSVLARKAPRARADPKSMRSGGGADGGFGECAVNGRPSDVKGVRSDTSSHPAQASGDDANFFSAPSSRPSSSESGSPGSVAPSNSPPVDSPSPSTSTELCRRSRPRRCLGSSVMSWPATPWHRGGRRHSCRACVESDPNRASMSFGKSSLSVSQDAALSHERASVCGSGGGLEDGLDLRPREHGAVGPRGGVERGEHIPAARHRDGRTGSAGSSSNSSRSARAYLTPSGPSASRLTCTVGVCSSLSTTRRTVRESSSPTRGSRSGSRARSRSSSASTTSEARRRSAVTVGVASRGALGGEERLRLPRRPAPVPRQRPPPAGAAPGAFCSAARSTTVTPGSSATSASTSRGSPRSCSGPASERPLHPGDRGRHQLGRDCRHARRYRSPTTSATARATSAPGSAPTGAV